MLFNEFYNTVKKYPNKYALNDWTYEDLFKKINQKEYKLVSNSVKEHIIVDILKAAHLNKPIIILPKYHKDNVELPTEINDEFSIFLYSSGSSGRKKSIRISEKQIYYNCLNAIQSQNINEYDNILTVCSLNHTGGINAQSLPGLLSGAHVIIDDFNAYNFSRQVKNYNVTLTHFVPQMIDTLMKIKSFSPGKLRMVVAGSDCVKKEQVEFFLNQSIPFMVNYGLTEAGPIVINYIFKSANELTIFDQGVPLGKKCWCNFKIENNSLYLNGDIVSKDGWLDTGDCVTLIDNWFVYRGRKSFGCQIIPKNYK